MMTKVEIRQMMRERRKALTPVERSAASAAICAKLAADSAIGRLADLRGRALPIAVYLASPQEIDLSPFIRRMLDMGGRVVVPRWNGEIYELAVMKGFGDAYLREGPMGILEPVEADVVPPRMVGAWLVPGLAFTRDGKRLGYGGGWYDRLLDEASDAVLKYAIAYTFQIIDDLPSEPHDIPLTGIIDDSPSVPCSDPQNMI